ncbi:carbohydrate-binding family 9-like protein [Segetibacter koreensis]|uniref:carbohydrate-binding family 9-like protein n=1 Tax=Segetibacter koreensis TaxID=398037 RepID=UPI0003791597|nr:carbohydrate-binding family 9-like protein [Segetibacter koreensis]
MNEKTPNSGNENGITNYWCRKIEKGIEINGDLNKPEWSNCEKSGRFVDMVTGEPGLFDTRSAALWDDENLYIAFWAEEPFVAATQKERDSIVFLENDLEVFIDGGDCYYELEVNALNTVYEVFFIWKDAYKKGCRFDVAEFDVFKEKAMTFGGDYDRSGESFWWGRNPRGLRWAFLDYDMPGLKTAVKVDGKINDPGHVDKGWTLEIAIPWKSMKWLANGKSLPPKEGDIWRIFLGRFQKMTPSGQEVQPHPAWVLSKHGVYDTHMPQCFPYIHFTNEIAK